MDKYLVFGNNNEYSNKYYTTNEYIIKKLKKYNRIDKISCTIGFIGVLAFISIFVFAFIQWEYSIQAIVASFALFILCIMVGLFISFKVSDARCKVYDIYYETDEYKKQYKDYCRKEQSKHDKLIYEKSKALVEAYETLDSSELTTEQKIQLMKKYFYKGYIK